MALATLSIDIEARLAKLEEGLDRASRIVQRSAADMSGRFDAANAAAVSLAKTLAVGFVTAGITRFTTEAIRSLDALNDFKDATGASIENASALEDIAARTGTAFETVETSVVRLNKVLADAKPGSDQAALLKAIGVEAEALKKLDPAEALLEVAKALDKFEDSGNKARIVQELFGKSVKEVAPFLNDLAAKGKLVATTTEEQAKQAEKFRQQLDGMAKNSADAARSLVSNLLPALNTALERFNKTTFGITDFIAALNKLTTLPIGGGLFDKLSNVQSSSELDRLKNLAAGLEQVRRSDEAAGRAENTNNTQRLAAINARIAALQAEENVRKRVQTPFDPSAGADAIRGIKQAAPDVPGGKKGSDAGLKAVEIARLQAEAEEQAAKDAADAWDFYTKQQLAQGKERTDAEKMMWKQVFEFIDSEQEREMEEAQKAFLDTTNEMTEFARQAARNIQDTLGTGLRRILDGDFKSIGSLFRNLILDMIAQAAAARIGNALFGDFLKGGSLGGFLGGLFNAKGNAFDGSGVAAFASGGVFNQPTAFAFGAGRLGVMGEAGPEAVVPLKRGRDGKLGVAGGGLVLTQNISVASGVPRAEMYATVQAANRELLEQLRAAGKI